MTVSTTWRRVTKADPCPICGKDHACKVSADGAVAMCKRVEQGAFKESKGWYFHRLFETPRPDYTEQAHRNNGKAKPQIPKAYRDAQAAIDAAGKIIGGSFVAGWTYHGRDGSDVLLVIRCVLPDGEKQYRPIHPAKDGWRIGDPSGPLPLYRLNDLPAAVTRGLPWTDDRGSAPLGSVMIANAEDGVADTIKPRLQKMGADCSRVHVLDCVKRLTPEGKIIERGFTLADVADLEKAMVAVRDCRLVIIDPVSAFLADADEHRNGEVRALLKPIVRLGERHGCAIVCITHLTKGGGANSVHRMIGSIGFAGAARSVWMVSKDPQNSARRLLTLAKCNIAADVGGLGFSIVDGAIAFEAEPVEQTADDVLAAENGGSGDEAKPGPEPVKRKAAEEWLRKLLADGEVEAAKVKVETQAAGLA